MTTIIILLVIAASASVYLLFDNMDLRIRNNELDIIKQLNELNVKKRK